MIRLIADNITSPLGSTTQENLRHILNGESRLIRYEGKWGIPEVFTASLFSEEQWRGLLTDGLTRFESLVYHSITEALSHIKVDVLTANTCLIVSTTKANVERLGQEDYTDYLPAASVQRIVQKLGLKAEPIVVCNACISGVAAQVLAKRLLDAGMYDYVIVTGCDVQSKFIVSGFQSLKALSEDECRPFDIERTGLNLGEAASTMIFAPSSLALHASTGSAHKVQGEDDAPWYLQAGAITNDAIHITNPSPKGVGSSAAIDVVTQGVEKEDIALINVHGTATMYNDQMESKAIESLGLSDIPVNALKGYYGHTMGAAGILETVLSLHGLDEGMIPATRGFEETGVSGRVNISNQSRKTTGHNLVKVISGFGGCNGAVFYSRQPKVLENKVSRYVVTHTVSITTTSITVDGEQIEVAENGIDMLTAAYKQSVGDYAKFYKMDVLSKLGFLATDLLLQKEQKERFVECSNRAVILFNQTSSMCADKEYLKSISNADEYYPSPSIFVYTLPNIVTGEIAIRNKYHGETSFYILTHKDEEMMKRIIDASFLASETDSMVTGWINADSKEQFEAEVSIIEKVSENCNK